MPVMDSRWVLISRLLQRDARWECAFVVDLTDVTLVAAPSCAALPRDRFYAASDGSSPKSARWLERRGELNEFNRSYPPAFRAFLDPMAYYRRCRANVSAPLLAGSGRQPCLYNAGIVGGRRPAFAAALAAVDARLCHSWASRKNRAMQIGSDMVAWNEAAVNASGRVLTGYPYGPLNLPMFGQMTHQDPTKAKEARTAPARAATAGSTPRSATIGSRTRRPSRGPSPRSRARAARAASTTPAAATRRRRACCRCARGRRRTQGRRDG